MKICILRHSYFPNDPRVRKEIYALKEKGFSVDIICLKLKNINKTFEIVDGMHIYRIPLSHERKGILRYFFEYGLSFILFTILVTYRFLKIRHDYIQVNTMPDFLVFAALIPKLLGTKIILDVHEPTPELWITKYNQRHRFLFYIQKYIEKLAIQFSDITLTVTEAMRKRLSERGADISKITVVQNVCEEIFSKYYKDERPVKDKFILITHGSIEERYGHDLIIKALSELRNEINNLTLEIFGIGGYEKDLKELVIKFHCEDMVVFRGYLPFNEMLNGINRGDVGIIAMKRSPYSELIDTNKLYEYISMGIPVIQSRLPAVEYNFDEQCLEYFDPDDYIDLKAKIKRLYLDPQRRKSIAYNALKKMNNFRWNVVKNKYTALFK